MIEMKHDWRVRVTKFNYVRLVTRIPILICVCLLAFNTIQCNHDSSREATSTLTLLVDADEWVMSPSPHGSAEFMIFLGLARPNERGELEGRLAESWEHTPGSREWTIHLRNNVRWHDGVPVTADDIKFTVDLFRNPDVIASTDNTGFYQIESVEVLNDTTFVLTYKPGSVWHTYWYPGYWPVFYPKHLLKDLDPAKIAEWEFWKHPVGNGPFRYVRHTPKTMMELEANPDFHLGKPKIDRVVLKFGPESITELKAGNVDVLNLPDQMVATALKSDPRFNVYYESWDDISVMLSLIYNHRNPLFADARVRRAIAHAIDRRELPRVLNMWEKLPVIDVPFTESQYWKREVPEPLPYDPPQARRLLKEAGWGDEGSGGFREREGKEFRFPMIVSKRYEPVAVYVQQKLAEVGINVEITTLEGKVVWERVYKRGDFDIALSYVWISPDDPDMGLEVMMGKNSAIGFQNAVAAKLVDDAMKAKDLKSLGSIYRELAPVVQKEQPFTFLTFGVEAYAAHRRVKGLSSPFRANPVWNAGYLWMEEEP